MNLKPPPFKENWRFYFKDFAKKQDEELEKESRKNEYHWVCTKCNSKVGGNDIKCKKCKSLLAVKGAVKKIKKVIK